jgi:hypothetical protein
MTDQADVGPGSAADTPGRTDSGDAPRPVLAPGEWDVFISYSRKDHAFATRLHAALNAYQPPRDLPLPQRRLQAFLDTSDFVAPDYIARFEEFLEAIPNRPLYLTEIR